MACLLLILKASGVRSARFVVGSIGAAMGWLTALRALPLQAVPSFPATLQAPKTPPGKVGPRAKSGGTFASAAYSRMTWVARGSCGQDGASGVIAMRLQ